MATGTESASSSGTSRAGSSLAGASVLVAGASGGIGAATARELADRGATLTLVARRAEQLAALDIPGHRVPLDLRTPQACDAAVAAAVEHGGRLDVVVNAVGLVAFGPAAELSVDAMEELFLTNTFIPMMLAKAAIARMEPGGAIVNISGVIAEQALPGMAAYSASKAAVRAFDEGFAREARRAKIRVIDARPPHTETGLADRPIEGTAPSMPTGLPPEVVAAVICDALAGDATDLPSTSFERPPSTD